MEIQRSKRLSKNDWIKAAVRALDERGIDGLKVVVLAKELGSTSGSFYWHFKDQPALLEAILDFWEVEQTDQIIKLSRAYEGPPEQRILNLMVQVISEDAARLDHAISVWARRDNQVAIAYERTIEKRFDHAAWMFRQLGFGRRQAAIRGRLMVAYLMGESSTLLKARSNWKKIIQDEFEVLIAPLA
ncbi:MAG: TetR/AcrR family transcriptional regulator [Hyphomicrobiales bacterium]